MREALPTENTPAAIPECRHCGGVVFAKDSEFCCNGCETVYGLLHENGLQRYYELEMTPGIIPPEKSERYGFLDDASLAGTLLDFDLGHTRGITLNIPAIHCAACIWLLEKLHRMHAGIGHSEVNLLRRRLRIQFSPAELSLKELVMLLDSLGYAPVFSLEDAEEAPVKDDGMKALLMRLGIAGFCFGNIMLFTFPFYLGLQPGTSPQAWSFTILSAIMSLPALWYSADIYWRKAWKDIQSRRIGIDVPITLGLAAMLGASVADVLLRQGEGYFDSLAGLIFFLLCGRVFQRKTFDRMNFDRDYKSYFPIAVLRIGKEGEQSCPLADLVSGDRIRVRSGELIPADSRLGKETAILDYSFITGESEPVTCQPDDLIYAGARVCGQSACFTVVQPVSQSYLTGLWNQDKRAAGRTTGRSMTDRIGPWFTATVLAVAMISGCVWLGLNAAVAPFVFAAVLIIACPCALALSAPFVYGQVIRILSNNGFYLRNADVVERLASIRHILFDKTGTLTCGYHVRFNALTDSDRAHLPLLKRTAAHSTHPLSRSIAGNAQPSEPESWQEFVSKGIASTASGHLIRLGHYEWLRECGVEDLPGANVQEGLTRVHAAIDNRYVGHFEIRTQFRDDLAGMLAMLQRRFRLGLISGDRQAAAVSLGSLNNHLDLVQMEAQPHEKTEVVKRWQEDGGAVLMVGDGLNDAAALRCSDVGVVVSDQTGSFCPASDIIVDAERLIMLPHMLTFARRAMALTATCMGLSLLYNVVGVSIAVTGHLSPLVAAILMPLSSFTIMTLALLGARVLAIRSGLEVSCRS